MLFVILLLLQVNVWLAKSGFRHDERKIAKVLLQYEKLGKDNAGEKLTAISPPPSSRTKRSAWSYENELVPLCAPWDSCQKRCSTNPRGLPFTCNCDKLCTFYGDCCSDYELQCYSKSGNSLKPNDFSSIASPTCETYDDFQWPIYVIRNCSSNWINSNSIYLREKLLLSDSDECTQLVTSCKENDTLHCKIDSVYHCKSKLKDYCLQKSNTQLVSDPSNLVFANSICATCNHKYIYRKILMDSVIKQNKKEKKPQKGKKSLPFNFNGPRACLPSINKCSDHNIILNNISLDDLCRNHGGAVASSNRLYKNVYCALCNGEDPNTLRCPTWLLNPKHNMPLENLYQSIRNLIFGKKIVGVQSLKFENMPAAFSILLNFGLDGRQKMIFSSESEEELRKHQKLCGEDRIWDPFSQICRKIYCSTEFVLINYECVEKTNKEINTTDTSPEIINNEPEFTHLSLNIEVDYLDLLRFYGKEQNITDIVAEALAKAFDISVSRIQNVKINVTFANMTNKEDMVKFIDILGEDNDIIFSIDLDLYEKLNDWNETEPTVDSVVSMLASELSINEIELEIATMKSKILEIHQTPGYLDTWCNPIDGDIRHAHWNSEFTLIFDTNISYPDTEVSRLYVNETGKLYEKGNFVASILYQGYQMKQDSVNISKLAIICDRKSQLNKSCPRILLQEHEYEINQNGTLVILNHINNTIIDTQFYEFAGNNSILVCYVPFRNSRYFKEYYLEFDVAQALVSLIFLCISVIALSLVLLTYILFPSLRNLPGWNAMNLTFSLLTMQITFLLGQRRVVVGLWCRIVAQLLHYEILCSFMWMNVMAYDLYKTFGKNTTSHNKIRSKKKYIWRYMTYSYGIPLVIMIICYLLEKFHGNSTISPHYGLNNACWIASKNAAIIFFACPLALVMVVNTIFYILTVKEIKAVKHIVKHDIKKKYGKNDLRLYTRIAFLIGLTWILSFVAAYVPSDELMGQITTYLFIIFNTLQGVFIFSVFICNKRVLGLYKDFLRRLASKPENYHKRSSIFTWISKSISRSISTDTVISATSASSVSLTNISIKLAPNSKHFIKTTSKNTLEQDLQRQIDELEKVCDQCFKK